MEVLKNLIGIIASAIVSAVITWWTTKKFFQDKTILPTASKDANSYTQFLMANGMNIILPLIQQ